MAWLWSNPSPDEFTSARASSQFKVDAPNIGPLVNAILDYRNSQAQQEQKRQDDMMKNISGAMSGIEKNKSTGQTADYMSLYNQAQDANVPGGESEAMRQLYENMSPDAKLAAAKFVNQQQEQALKDQYLQSRTNAADALANQRWTGETGGGAQKQLTPNQNILAAERSQKAAKQAFAEFGIPAGVINDPNAIHAPSETPYRYRTGDKETTVPEGTNLVVDPKTGSYSYPTPDYITQARAAMEAYQKSKENYRSVLDRGGANAGTSGGASPAAISEANRIKAEFKAGRMSAEDAQAAIEALGIF